MAARPAATRRGGGAITQRYLETAANEAGWPFQIERPGSFGRKHVFVRLTISIAFILLAGPVWFFALVYFSLPLAVAAVLSPDSPESFRTHDSRTFRRAIHWLVAFDAYMTLLSDRFPARSPQRTVDFDVPVRTTPSTATALLRLSYSFPSAAALAVVRAIAVFTWLIAALSILRKGNYSDLLYRYHLGVVRWGANLLAYHASLVDEYPPFALDSEPEGVWA